MQQLPAQISSNAGLRRIERRAAKTQFRIRPKRTLVLQLEAACAGGQWLFNRPRGANGVLERFEHAVAMDANRQPDGRAQPRGARCGGAERARAVWARAAWARAAWA